MSKPQGSHFSYSGLFAKKHIKIPEYQRTYDWRKSHLEGLIQDLAEHIEIQDKILDFPYFLGNLMIHKSEQDDKEYWYLVDGQQRLVTMTLLAGFIRDRLIENEEYKSAFDLQNAVISKDDKGNERYFVPRDTGKIDSPSSMLWPVQSPPKQEVSFLLDKAYPVGNYSKELFKIKNKFIAKFPLPVGDYEIAPGVKLHLLADNRAGEEIEQFYGNLEVNSEIKENDICKIHFGGRDELIKAKLTNGKWPDYLIRKHYKKHLPQLLETYLDKSNQKDAVKILLKWKDVITGMHFTTTTFTSESDAIFYFGKLNESETKLQLNVGDLMRHHVQYITSSPPDSPNLDKKIYEYWNTVENSLKSEKQKDMIPYFMDGWLISQGRKTSKRLIYKLLKSDLSVHKSANTYDKTKVTGDMKKIQEASTYFRQIVFPEPSDDYYLRMDCFERLGDQHRGLFLAGFLGFHRHGDKTSMERLMAIWEILKMKGEQLPKMCDFDGIPSNEVYSYVNKWSKMIYDVNNFEKPILPATAKSILDKIAREVKSKCDKTWTTSNVNWLGKDIADIVKQNETNQNRSKMILTRIEISKKGTSKTWKTSVEVEHIAPKSYQKDWINKSKGGGFIDKDDYKKVYIENIGNRTLLDPGSNKPLTNLGFHAKQNLAKHGYNQQSSSWYVTKGLEDTAISVWGPREIEERAEKLVKELVVLYDDAFIGL